MALRVGINGFGRIGRMVFRSICGQGLLGNGIDVNAIVDICSEADYLAYQLRHDSTHHKFRHEILPVKSSQALNKADCLSIDGHRIRCIAAPEKLDGLAWKDLDVDLVIESTGLFTDSESVVGHLRAGADKVVITAPASKDIKTIIMGINEHEYNPGRQRVISGGSCTTHCLAMLVRILIDEGIGLESGLMTAINSYTGSQRILDGFSRRDWRSGRAAAVNIVPSVTNATQILEDVLPVLKGKMAGLSFRVPTPDVSIINLAFRSTRDSSIGEIDGLMKKASETYLKGHLRYTDEELVSTDFIHDSRSAIYDSPATLRSNIAGEKRSFRIVAWYDNEWGYSNRIVDLLQYMRDHAEDRDARTVEESGHYLRWRIYESSSL
jgi:glyceraldehyde 3-phosphate dehydrogenase